MSSLTDEQKLIFNKLIDFSKDNSKYECLINSSAGVGKTYTIIQFLKRWIVGVQKVIVVFLKIKKLDEGWIPIPGIEPGPPG